MARGLRESHVESGLRAKRVRRPARLQGKLGEVFLGPPAGFEAPAMPKGVAGDFFAGRQSMLFRRTDRPMPIGHCRVRKESFA